MSERKGYVGYPLRAATREADTYVELARNAANGDTYRPFDFDSLVYEMRRAVASCFGDGSGDPPDMAPQEMVALIAETEQRMREYEDAARQSYAERLRAQREGVEGFSDSRPLDAKSEQAPGAHGVYR